MTDHMFTLMICTVIGILAIWAVVGELKIYKLKKELVEERMKPMRASWDPMPVKPVKDIVVRIRPRDHGEMQERPELREQTFKATDWFIELYTWDRKPGNRVERIQQDVLMLVDNRQRVASFHWDDVEEVYDFEKKVMA